MSTTHEFKTLRNDAGYRLIDTAEYYQNEEQAALGVKKWLSNNPKFRREDIYFVTKVAPKEISGLETEQSIKTRIEILGPIISYIDLVLIHAPHGGPDARKKSWKSLETFDEENPGKVKSFGVSNYNVKHLSEIINSRIKPQINQLEVNPWLTRKEIVDYCNKCDIVVQAYSPLTRGRRLDDPQIVALAKKYGKTSGQILLKWSLQKGFVPLPKSTTPSRIKENYQVFGWKLDDEDVKNLTHDDAYWVSVDHWDPTKLE